MASNYKAPSHSSSLNQPTVNSQSDASGVAGGLSSKQGFDSENSGPMVDYSVDGLTGNAPERVEPYPVKSVTEKGKKIEIC